LENNVCLIQNIPSKSSITRTVRGVLGYSYKWLKVVARESLSVECEQRLVNYLSVCSTLDARNMHFFNEYSVIKTTGNRHYGHSGVGSPAAKVQRYASNANYTVNLLHSISGINHLNILDGPSNGLEALEEEDLFGNPVLNAGDTVIMDNYCGFHHGRFTEPILRDMLARNGCSLVFQPLYHPVYSTCEHCFRVLKGWLRKHAKLTEESTHIAIYDGLGQRSLGMSRNFFKYCG